MESLQQDLVYNCKKYQMFCLHLASVDQFKQILTTFGQNSVEEVVKYCENDEIDVIVLPNYLIFDFAGIT